MTSTALYQSLTLPTLRIKKRNIEEHLEKTMIEVVDRIMKAQEASDDKFALLEEKRTRLEEKLLQSEEKQRQQDWEFQMKMQMMMTQGMNATTTPTSSSVPYRNTCPMPRLGTDNFFLLHMHFHHRHLRHMTITKHLSALMTMVIIKLSIYFW